MSFAYKFPWRFRTNRSTPHGTVTTAFRTYFGCSSRRQQQKASVFTNACSMWWDTLIIGWCLCLRRRAYEMLQESGWVTLPSQRTLRDYTHYVNSTTGFSTEVDKQLMAAAKAERSGEWEGWKIGRVGECVVLIMDKMHAKEDLVYDKHSGTLIGFAKLISTSSSSKVTTQTVRQ